jgi:hypothetical protein
LSDESAEFEHQSASQREHSCMEPMYFSIRRTDRAR